MAIYILKLLPKPPYRIPSLSLCIITTLFPPFQWPIKASNTDVDQATVNQTFYPRRSTSFRSMNITSERCTLIWIHLCLCTPVACLCIVSRLGLFQRLHFFHVSTCLCCSVALVALENNQHTPMTYLTGPSHEVVSVKILTLFKRILGITCGAGNDKHSINSNQNQRRHL